MKINLSKFKKIDSDDNCTTLLHPSGHEIKIAHKGLTDDMRKELEDVPMQLAKGGYSKFSQKFDPNIKKKESKPAKADTQMPGSPTEAKKAVTEPQDAGPDVVLAAMNKKAPPFGPLGEPKYHQPPCINPACKSYGHAHPNCTCYGGKMSQYGGYAEGGEVDDKYFCNANRMHFKDCEYFAEGGMTDSEKLDAAAQEASVGSAPVTEQPPPSVNLTAQDINPNAEMKPNQEWEGSYGVATPEPPPEPEPLPTETPSRAPASPIETLQKHKDDALNTMVPEAQNFASDLDNGHIQPKTYHDLFANQSTLGKIGTLFGLIVGGAGAGLSHQPNILLGMMNKEIENDLAAQQQSSSNKQNFLKINQQALMNRSQIKSLDTATSIQAKTLALANMRRTALHDLSQKVMNMPEGPQKVQQMQVLAMMNDAVQKEDNDTFTKAAFATGLQKTMFGDSGNAPNTTMMKSGIMGPEAKNLGEDLETKTIPGVPGKAQRPVPEHHRDQVQAMNVLDQKAEDLIKFSKQHEGTWNPKTRAVAAQKAEEMVNFYNNSIQGGVLTEGRLKWLDDQIKKNPTSIIAQELSGNNARLQEIKDSNVMRKNLLLQSLGFPVKKSSPQTTTSKSGREIIHKDGKAYYK